MKSKSRPSDHFDRAGILVALACGIHCFGLTLLFMLYPALWLNRSLRESGLWQWLLWLEWSLALLAAVLLITALVVGRRRHRRRLPGFLGLGGLILLLAAVFTRLHWVPWWGSAAALSGGVLIALAHTLNLRTLRRARRAPDLPRPRH